MRQDFIAAITFFVFTLIFLFGSFTSSFLEELVSKRNSQLSHVIPIALEIIILAGIGIFGSQTDISTLEGKLIAFFLLFAMGIQNSLVTNISRSIVRTTHLTGLFTDLGIELSQLFFYKQEDEVKKLKTSIFLRLAIITFFFIGCFFGGIIYQFIEIKTLLIAAICLLFAQLYDYLRLKFHRMKRKKIRFKTL